MSFVLENCVSALILFMMLTLVPLAVAAALGFCVTLLQSLFSLQEPTLTFSLRLSSVLLVVLWCGAAGLRGVVALLQRSLELVQMVSSLR